jgi:hypothetical protein
MQHYLYFYFLETYNESKENNSKDEDINNNRAFVPLSCINFQTLTSDLHSQNDKHTNQKKKIT